MFKRFTLFLLVFNCNLVIAGQNLALRKNYTLWPKPNYYLCTDKPDSIQLTDGKKYGSQWTSKSSVGWQSAEPAVEIVIDLGTKSVIKEVRIHTVGGGFAEVEFPEFISVLLSDDGRLLPLSQSVQVHVAGTAADSLDKQCGGWTIDWQGLGGGMFPSTTTGTTIRDGIESAIGSSNVTYSESGTGISSSADYVIVVMGEESYAAGQGDETNLDLGSVSPDDITALNNAASSGLPVIAILVTGRPLIIESYLDLADAWLVAWLPGTEGDGVADVLFGDYAPVGTLSHSWPRSMAQIPINVGDADYSSDPPLFPFGYGLTY